MGHLDICGTLHMPFVSPNQNHGSLVTHTRNSIHGSMKEVISQVLHYLCEIGIQPRFCMLLVIHSKFTDFFLRHQ